MLGGGGFTGVELAGEIADWYPVLCEKHGIARPQNLLKLVEMMNTILPAWNRALAQRCQKVMGELGVELHLSDPVVWVTENSIELKSGEILEPDLFVWTGGVTRDPACGPYFDIKSGRIAIDKYCRADEFEDIYVAGDCACTVNESGLTMSPTAHIAMGQAAIVAHNIVASLMGDPLKPYVFNHVGEIVTIGRSYAAGDLFGIRFSGFLAKAMKRIIHWWYLYSIGGFSLLLER